eukprot:768926_1
MVSCFIWFPGPSVFIFYSLFVLMCYPDPGADKMNEIRPEIRIYRKKARDMFYHGFNNYMEHAFPHDELKPISASFVDSLIELGDAKPVKGVHYVGVALTLIDSLDTLAVLGDTERFREGVNYLSAHVRFDLDVRVHVFETTIRALGGLLSAHTLASDGALEQLLMPEYEGELLTLADDLGSRLLLAFDTIDGIPYSFVNLRQGVLPHEDRSTCVACVGTLLLEFGALSHLTGDTRYYNAARRALDSMWSMRSSLNLLGNTFNGGSRMWINDDAGIGAGSDSFYEYLIKSYVMFGDEALRIMFEKSYVAVMKYIQKDFWYKDVRMSSGRSVHFQFNSLQAFWPALQVLHGEIADAEETFDNFFSLWEKFGALPERYYLHSNTVHGSQVHYPLRPELIESAYFLYRATGDPKYQKAGMVMLDSINEQSRVEHGYAVLDNVLQKEKKGDIMPSYFLAETCKYLYLLFDEENFLNQRDDFILTTEAHPLKLSYEIQQKFGGQTPKPSATSPRFKCWKDQASQSPNAHAQFMFGGACEGQGYWDACGASPVGRRRREKKEKSTCTNPKLIFEETSSDNDWVDSVMMDGTPVKIAYSVGGFSMIASSEEQTEVRGLGTDHNIIEIATKSDSGVDLLLYDENGGFRNKLHILGCDAFADDKSITVGSSLFGPADLGEEQDEKKGDDEGDWDSSPTTPRSVPLVKGAPISGCSRLHDIDMEDKFVYLERGGCMFIDKIRRLEDRGAAGAIIGNVVESDRIFMMTADEDGQLTDIPTVMIPFSDSEKLKKCLNDDQSQVSVFLSTEPAKDCTDRCSRVSGTVNDFMVTTPKGHKYRAQKRSGAYQLLL